MTEEAATKEIDEEMKKIRIALENSWLKPRDYEIVIILRGAREKLESKISNALAQWEMCQ
jgi:hypothetical protein